MLRIITLLCLLSSTIVYAQDTVLPYYELPEAPGTYTAGAVAARMVDALGFRYYWATEGLRDEDLAWSPGDEARSSMSTIRHIHGLTVALVNTTRRQPTVGGVPAPDTFQALRKATLLNIQEAANQLRTATPADLEVFDMVFKGSNSSSEYPFWNVINGPVADALWHVGQVVSFRRSSGNPLPSGVNVLEGKKTD